MEGHKLRSKSTRPSGSQVSALKQNIGDEKSLTPTRDTSDLGPLGLASEEDSG